MRCAKPLPSLRQRGAAIILALVTVFLTATIASAILASLGRSIDSTTGLNDQAQARRLARAAIDWARNVLADDKMRTSVDHIHEPWAVRIPPMPLEEAEIAGQIQDRSGYFNLNMLAPNGIPNPAASQNFSRLLNALSLPPAQATQLSTALTTALTLPATSPNSSAPARPSSPETARFPQGPLVHLHELRYIDGFSAPLIQALERVAFVGPAPSKINLNMAPPAVLYAITRNLSLSQAQVLVAERERIWFRNIADFQARLPANAKLENDSSVDVISRFFLVTGRARYGVAIVSLEVLLDRQKNWSTIVWQHIP